MGLLEGAGYERVRDFPGGLAGWQAQGGQLVRGGPHRRRLARPRSWPGAVIANLEGASARTLMRYGVGLVLVSALAFLFVSLVPGSGLRVDGELVGWDATGLGDALYFSLVTATTLGYGDITPVGLARVIAVTEALAGLLLFGAVISKFLSQRQEALVEELHRLTFEDRLDRVQTNLHLVITEVFGLSDDCQREGVELARLRPRLESAVQVFTSELRAIHDLLYRPQTAPPEEVFEGLLASLSAALDGLVELFSCSTAQAARDERLDRPLAEIARLANQICGECVPEQHAAGLREWMDRIREQARALGPSQP